MSIPRAYLLTKSNSIDTRSHTRTEQDLLPSLHYTRWRTSWTRFVWRSKHTGRRKHSDWLVDIWTKSANSWSFATQFRLVWRRTASGQRREPA
jgi:hypothetical protein